ESTYLNLPCVAINCFEELGVDCDTMCMTHLPSSLVEVFLQYEIEISGMFRNLFLKASLVEKISEFLCESFIVCIKRT
ncbi:hypothetical protein CDAR_247311, partial [Caerostris darwini]